MSFRAATLPAPAELAARVSRGWRGSRAHRCRLRCRPWMTWARGWSDALPWLQLPAWREGAGQLVSRCSAATGCQQGCGPETGEYRFGLTSQAMPG